MKQIPNYKDYCVTEEGRVWSIKSYRFLKGRPDRRGYLQVSLPYDGHFKNRFVHQLVLETFVGPKQSGSVTRHLDGNPKNNCLNNLMWGTPKENAEDWIKHTGGPCGENQGGSKLTWDDVEFIRWLYKQKVFTLAGIAKFFNVCFQNISAIVNNKTWKVIDGSNY